MSVQVINAADAIARLAEFDAVIDARTEAEFAEDRLPGAVNWPSLNNEERIEVGTIYKQVSPFEARKRGAMLVSANISRHIGREIMDKPKSWKPLAYCWRGGQRSGALALVLGQIGFRVHVVEGGYKAFRTAVLAALPALAGSLTYRVVCGPTGSGKTRLLHALEAAGAQVLDLEGLASHRSSVLGVVPGQPQPSQKNFDTRVWERLRSFDPSRPVFVESESRKVGNLAVPGALIDAMRASECIRVELPIEERVKLLLEDYDFFVKDPEFFCRRLDALVQLRGKAQVQAWQASVRAGDLEVVVRELLEKHYDPGYQASIERNFSRHAAAEVWSPRSHSHEAMTEVAQAVIPAKAGIQGFQKPL
ncbi:tRNA 2-selenouridine(34) synthase MnmH [Ramlibacter sp.]|uniref:tRNA 2-selenouridine(34) synthase MnmH n=1 Tax=Ramlibacter sp. TaxID=1917967 RepID=UPI003D0EC73D